MKHRIPIWCACMALFALLTASCGFGPEANYPSSVPSSYNSSSSFSSGSAPSSFAPPSRSGTSEDLVVKPDLLCVPFAVRVIDRSAENATKVAETTVREISSRFSTATAGAVTTRMLGLLVRGVSAGKALSEESLEYEVVADGAIEAPLGVNLDYWSRGRLVVALVGASKAATVEKKDEQRPSVQTTFSPPEAKLKDPEVHRPQLLKRWIERARQFAALASTQEPLALVDCTPPGAIAQRPLSLEEVGLSLVVQCRLEVKDRADGGNSANTLKNEK